MSKDKFPLPAEFRPPEGYVIQAGRDNIDWLFTTTGQELSTKRVRELIDDWRKKLEKATTRKPNGITTVHDDETAARKEHERQLAENLQMTIDRLKDAVSGSLQKGAQSIAEVFDSIRENPPEGADRKMHMSAGSGRDRFAFARGIRDSFTDLNVAYHQSFTRFLEAALRQFHSKPGQEALHAFALEIPLRDLEMLLNEFGSVRTEILDFVANTDETPEWWYWNALTILKTLESHTKNLQTKMNGLNTIFGAQEDENRQQKQAVFLTMMTICAQKDLKLRVLNVGPLNPEKDQIRSIVAIANRHNTPRHERVNAFARELRELLISLELSFTDPDDSEDLKEEVQEALSHADAISEEIDLSKKDERKNPDENPYMIRVRQCEKIVHLYLKERIKELREFVPEEKLSSGRKGKDDKKKNHNYTAKTVLRKLEAFVNAFIQSRKIHIKNIYMRYTFEGIAEAFSETGKQYGSNYQTNFIIPEPDAGEAGLPQEP